MKLVALFLALIVCTLTVTPCCALEPSDSQLQITSLKDKCNEQSDQCANDCSPFYVCGTCIGFAFPDQQIVTFAAQLNPVQHNTIYIPVQIPAPIISIWQPPKLS